MRCRKVGGARNRGTAGLIATGSKLCGVCAAISKLDIGSILSRSANSLNGLEDDVSRSAAEPRQLFHNHHLITRCCFSAPFQAAEPQR